MQKIHKLSEQVIARIAAGEVIERPAYAVKELLENAIDAKADTIHITLEQAGLKKIMITDNGDGMNEADLQMSFQHHTTSKLSEHNDLTGIKSFGFRGEALSSIAAVSTLTIKSRSKRASLGTLIELHTGKIIKKLPIGMPQGTSIIVDHLFSSTPVRRKFLKSERTELRLIMDIVLQAALAHPQIRFQFVHNKRTLFDLPKTKSIIQRVKMLLGIDIFSALIPIQFDDPHIQIAGFISKPHLISTTSQKQYLFINGRSVTDTSIAQSVKEGYSSLLDNRTYPVFVLFLTLPYETVDVNIHPRKEQVAFLNKQQLLTTIKTAVEKTLQQNNITPYDIGWNNNMPSYATSILKDEILPWQVENLARIIKSSDVAQFHNVYIVKQTYNGILLIDQHAAHERILYEQFTTLYEEKKREKKQHILSNALSLELSPVDMSTVLEYKNTLSELGFQFEQFGNTMIQVTHIPLFFKSHDIKALFSELLHNISQSNEKKIDTQSQKMLAFLACRTAIKAGDKLHKKQCENIIEQLEKTLHNATCPHGRPTRVEISLHQINKLFKRK